MLTFYVGAICYESYPNFVVVSYFSSVLTLTSAIVRSLSASTFTCEIASLDKLFLEIDNDKLSNVFCQCFFVVSIENFVVVVPRTNFSYDSEMLALFTCQNCIRQNHIVDTSFIVKLLKIYHRG